MNGNHANERFPFFLSLTGICAIYGSGHVISFFIFLMISRWAFLGHLFPIFFMSSTPSTPDLWADRTSPAVCLALRLFLKYKSVTLRRKSTSLSLSSDASYFLSGNFAFFRDADDDDDVLLFSNKRFLAVFNCVGNFDDLDSSSFCWFSASFINLCFAVFFELIGGHGGANLSIKPKLRIMYATHVFPCALHAVVKLQPTDCLSRP